MQLLGAPAVTRCSSERQCAERRDRLARAHLADG